MEFWNVGIMEKWVPKLKQLYIKASEASPQTDPAVAGLEANPA
jgi:hypothetical protein